METKNETQHNIRLTSAEIAQLWSTYMNDSLARCALRYFANNGGSVGAGLAAHAVLLWRNCGWHRAKIFLLKIFI